MKLELFLWDVEMDIKDFVAEVLVHNVHQSTLPNVLQVVQKLKRLPDGDARPNPEGSTDLRPDG